MIQPFIHLLRSVQFFPIFICEALHRCSKQRILIFQARLKYPSIICINRNKHFWCCTSSMYSTSLGSNGLGPIMLISPPDVKVETTFFQRNFFITEPCTYPRKIAQKKEPPISQKSLFYAISLKFICCLLCCLLHIKFDQIMLYMAHSSQSVCLFLIPITCIPDHP